MTTPVPADDENVMRRHFVAVATSTYEDEHYGSLPVENEVEQLRRWLTDRERLGRRAFDVGSPAVGLDPDEDVIRRAFRNPARPWTERDAAVVFVTGHGEVEGNKHWLVLRASEQGDLGATAVSTADLIRWLHRRGGVEHLLLIIDACFAGAAAGEINDFDRPFPKTWLMLSSASRDQTATTGALTAAIAGAVEELRGPIGPKRGGTHRRYFLVSQFVDTVTEHLHRTDPGQDLVRLGYQGIMQAEHVCLPNPHYREPDSVVTQPQRHDLALPKSDLATHWGPRQSGADAGRWLFTGRADLMRTLVEHVTPEPTRASSTLLVTGGAGSGKSAVLARLVTLSDPDFVDLWADRVAEIPDDLRPPVGAVDVAVLATNKYPHEIIGQIAAAMEVERATDVGVGLDAHIDTCRAHLADRAAAGLPTVMVVDALDEAADPGAIASALARLTGGNGVKLIVGVRSPSGSGDHQPRSGSLADHVERLTAAHRIRVDEDPWWHQDDVRDYAASYLRHTPESPYRDAGRHDLAGRLAEVIAERVGRSFLIARLAAHALTQRSGPVQPDDSAWLDTVDDNVVTAFRSDLDRAYRDQSERQAAVELLRAVAFAYGRGLPWGDIWPAVANAVAGRSSKFGDRDIAELLASPMSAYLVTSVEDDATVYSLFHDALRSTLRERWRDLLSS
ncbi:ATP-binding protein [Pseudonocardia charpentierae]|uniref:ATP-binding protein n=1 Tax=Pseudonocardia charpentierae TaxID=3075545 RepID=A0ABU2NK54_9PSEU|nr:ATP-binding protein [Pseudonocardia sp. DSM 45834]MDT0353378.1 ATP-binding protein [Pseudonocardia sp. DSM 45834]